MSCALCYLYEPRMDSAVSLCRLSQRSMSYEEYRQDRWFGFGIRFVVH
jgi:hypothetical protein